MEKQTDVDALSWHYLNGNYYILEWGETGSVYQLDINKAEFFKVNKIRKEIQDAEKIELFNTGFCDCN